MKIEKSKTLTQEQGLVQEVTSGGWFTNPAGRHGYAVVVLEMVGHGGTRFYRTLRPGETLDWQERLLRKFTVLAVDLRGGQSFTIEGQFAARERGRTVTLRAKVYYKVIDPMAVAVGTHDSLGALRDRVIATINSELTRHPEQSINPAVVRQVIRKVGKVSSLGLMVESAEVLEFKGDSRVTQSLQEEESARHEGLIKKIRFKDEIEENVLRERTKIRIEGERHAAIDLTDINVFLNRFPEMADRVFSAFTTRDQYLLQERMNAVKPAIDTYIAQQRGIDAPVDAEEILKLLTSATATPPRRIRLGSAPELGPPPSADSEPSAPLVIRPSLPPAETRPRLSKARIRLGDSETEVIEG